MKLFILRHEDRPIDCSFFSPLTEKGLINAKNLVPILTKCKINYIISSPFIRTLQTILPYSKKHNININIEYSLSELHHENLISKQAYGVSLPTYLEKFFNNNKNYKTLINPTDIVYPETMEHIDKRLKIFLKYLFSTYHNTNYNIVLVTHQALCNVLIKIISKYKSINESLLTTYPKGKLCLVYDNEWCCTEIN